MILQNSLNLLITELRYSGSADIIEACKFIYDTYGINVYVYMLPRGFRSAIQYRINYNVITASGKKCNSQNEAYNTGIQEAIQFVKLNINKNV